MYSFLMNKMVNTASTLSSLAGTDDASFLLRPCLCIKSMASANRNESLRNCILESFYMSNFL